MKIGIITAMPEERRAVLKGHQFETTGNNRKQFRFRTGGHDITVVEAGMGRINASSAATDLAAEGLQLMISCGFGGGVLPGLMVGDVVVALQVLRWNGSKLEVIKTAFHNNPAGTVDLPSGCFITSDGILNKQELVKLLPKDTARPVVDMESAAVAQVAANQGIPFLGIRAISDPWNEELSFSIDEFCDLQMHIRPLKVLTTVLRRPLIIPQLIRLAINSRIAAQSLGAAINQTLDLL